MRAFIEMVRERTGNSFPGVYAAIDRTHRISWSDVFYLSVLPMATLIIISIFVPWHIVAAVIGGLLAMLIWTLISFDVIAMPWEYKK